MDSQLVQEVIQFSQRTEPLKDGKLQKAVQDVIASRVVPDMFRVIDILCSDNIPLSASKEAMKIVAGAVDIFDDLTTMVQFLEKFIQCTLPRQNAYDEAIILVREKAAAKYEACGHKKEAAEELKRLFEFINECASDGLDSQDTSSSQKSVRNRINICVHAAKLLSEVGEIDGAQRVLVRVSDKVADMPSADRTVLEYKLLNAKLFDIRHDFSRAAQKYVELVRQSALSREERVQCLLCCFQCVLLSAAGPDREKMLDILLKNELAPSLACFSLLKRINSQPFLREADVVALEGILQEHQRVPVASEMMAPLKRAVIQHNLFKAANFYHSIRLNELGQLLGVQEDEAETIAADMIRQKRVDAKIDQIGRLLYFNNKKDPLAVWDEHIEFMCHTADEAAEMIKLVGDMQ